MWDYVYPETFKKCLVKCQFGSDEVSTEEVTELPSPNDSLQLMDDTEWAVCLV